MKNRAWWHILFVSKIESPYIKQAVCKELKNILMREVLPAIALKPDKNIGKLGIYRILKQRRLSRVYANAQTRLYFSCSHQMRKSREICYFDISNFKATKVQLSLCQYTQSTVNECSFRRFSQTKPKSIPGPYWH